MSSPEAIKYHTIEVAASPDTITALPARLHGFAAETDKTNDCTVVISDGATQILTYIVTGNKDSFIHSFPTPIHCESGLVVTLEGTASRAVFFYDLL
jgi:hypothetical protein